MIRINASRMRAVALAFALSAPVLTGSSGFRKSEKQSPPFTDKYWQMVSFTANPALDWDLDGKPETDIFALIDPCDKDDAIRFAGNGTFLRHRGKVQCDEDEETEAETGTWKYDATGKKLTINEGENSVQQYTVTEAGAARLVLTLDRKVKNQQHKMIAVFKIR